MIHLFFVKLYKFPNPSYIRLNKTESYTTLIHSVLIGPIKCNCWQNNHRCVGLSEKEGEREREREAVLDLLLIAGILVCDHVAIQC